MWLRPDECRNILVGTVEVPVMLTVVHLTRRSRRWYEAGVALHADRGS
jgi:hypothetical protein